MHKLKGRQGRSSLSSWIWENVDIGGLSESWRKHSSGSCLPMRVLTVERPSILKCSDFTCLWRYFRLITSLWPPSFFWIINMLKWTPSLKQEFDKLPASIGDTVYLPQITAVFSEERWGWEERSIGWEQIWGGCNCPLSSSKLPWVMAFQFSRNRLTLPERFD